MDINQNSDVKSHVSSFITEGLELEMKPNSS